MFYEGRHFVGLEEATYDSLRDFLFDVRQMEFYYSSLDPAQYDHFESALRVTRPPTALFQIFGMPSLRTRVTYERAAQKLGASVGLAIGEQYSAFIESERTLAQGVRTCSDIGYNAFVVRVEVPGAVQELADMCTKEGYPSHIISAGEGRVSQPSQTLCDLYTAFQAFQGRFFSGDLTCVMVGDVGSSPTLHDFLRGVALLRSARKVILVSECKEEDQPPEDVLEKLVAAGIVVEETDQLMEIASVGDLFYFTQYCKSPYKQDGFYPHLADRQRYAELFGAPSPFVQQLSSEARVIHPGPTGLEFPPEVDADKRFLHNRPMAVNGLLTKMMLLLRLLNPTFSIPARVAR